MKYINRLSAFLPTRLPIGLVEFHAWADSIIALLPNGFEKVPNDDLKWVLATSIQHLDATKAYVAKRYFILLLHKAAASQVASQVFQDIKIKQQEAKDAALKLEVTPQETSNGEKV